MVNTQKDGNNKREVVAVEVHRGVQSSVVVNRCNNKQRSKQETEVVTTTPRVQKFYEDDLNGQDFDEIFESCDKEVSVEEAEEVAGMPTLDMDVDEVHERMRERTVRTKNVEMKRSAGEMKQKEIDKALVSAMRKSAKTQPTKKMSRSGMGWKRIVLSFACAAVVVFAIVYFVDMNAPNIAIKVAAMQTGINATYPSYIPREYSIVDITSENGKVTLNFKDSSTGDSYSLIEENSSWDSNALLNNYVKDELDDYTIIKEQGLTIFVSGSDAAWVNGGVVYKIKNIQGTLTKKQITTIATSL